MISNKKIKKTLFIALLSLFFSVAVLPKFVKAEIYLIDLYKEESGKIIWDKESNLPVSFLQPVNFVKELVSSGDYKVKIFSFSDTVLNEINFAPMSLVANDWFDSENNKIIGGMKIVSFGPFKLTLPYYPNAQYAEIFDSQGNKQLKIYLSAFAACNENEICEQGEDDKNCPSDCHPKTPLTGFGKFWRWSLTTLYWLAILALIVFLVIKVRVWRKAKKNR